MIDLYCERIGPGLWAEPLNALTNLAFLMAAAALWIQARRLQAATVEIGVLIGLVAAIGVGSTLFHTFASAWAFAADVTPILLYQVTYLWIYGQRVMRLPVRHRVALLALFLIAGMLTLPFRDLLSGSLSYLPALFLLLALGGYHYANAQSGRSLLLWAAALLLGSLTFRTLDLVVCPQIPFGTHFLWHLLNGLLLYLTVYALLIHEHQGRATFSRGA